MLRFHEDYLEKEVKLSPADPLPPVGLIKEWLRWLANASEGRIGSLITQGTLRTYWSRFREGVRRETHQQFPDKVRIEINEVR